MIHSSRILPKVSRAENDELGGTDVRSSIRSRNRKLEPGGAQELLGRSSGNGSERSTPSVSRAVSPIPSKHPSRGAIRGANSNDNESRAFMSESLGKISTRLGGDLLAGGWEAGWSRLQGLANTVLGVDINGDEVGKWRPGAGAISRTNSGPIARKKTPGFWPSSGTWGASDRPTRQDEIIGNGSTTEREAAVRAKKMARVLESRDLAAEGLDVNGNMKRRTSLEEAVTDSDANDDALVFIHPVQPQDTIAGVVLRYNCQPAIFRKANGFWPNDSIQTRKVVLLPVDACAARGRPCEPPSRVTHTSTDLVASHLREGPSSPFSGELAFSSCIERSAAGSAGDDEKPWTHVRWVTLDSNLKSIPVEIGRMSRRTLGYFPPRRRKSQSTLSTSTTPRPSSDWSRSAQIISSSVDCDDTHASGSPQMNNSRSAPHSRNGSYFSQNASHSRRESVAVAADRLGWVKGPGGVGTLSKSVRRPGPGEDAFNAWANKHIPGITIDSMPSASIPDSGGVSFGFKDELANIAEGRYEGIISGTATPNASNQGKGLEHAAAAVEGWFRRFATTAPGTPKLSSVGRPEPGDLIELLDGTGSDDGRGFELNPGTMRSSNGVTGREDLDGVLRGRDKAGAKGGKSD